MNLLTKILNFLFYFRILLLFLFRLPSFSYAETDPLQTKIYNGILTVPHEFDIVLYHSLSPILFQLNYDLSSETRKSHEDVLNHCNTTLDLTPCKLLCPLITALDDMEEELNRQIAALAQFPHKPRTPIATSLAGHKVDVPSSLKRGRKKRQVGFIAGISLISSVMGLFSGFSISRLFGGGVSADTTASINNLRRSVLESKRGMIHLADTINFSRNKERANLSVVFKNIHDDMNTLKTTETSHYENLIHSFFYGETRSILLITHLADLFFKFSQIQSLLQTLESCRASRLPLIISERTLEMELLKFKDALALSSDYFELAVDTSVQDLSFLYAQKLTYCRFSLHTKSIEVTLQIPLIRKNSSVELFEVINVPFSAESKICRINHSMGLAIKSSLGLTFLEHYPHARDMCSLKEGLCSIHDTYYHSSSIDPCEHSLLQDSNVATIQKYCIVMCDEKISNKTYVTSLYRGFVSIAHLEEPAEIICPDHTTTIPPFRDQIGSILLNLKCECSLHIKDYPIIYAQEPCIVLFNQIPLLQINVPAVVVSKMAYQQMTPATLNNIYSKDYLYQNFSDFNIDWLITSNNVSVSDSSNDDFVVSYLLDYSPHISSYISVTWSIITSILIIYLYLKVLNLSHQNYIPVATAAAVPAAEALFGNSKDLSRVHLNKAFILLVCLNAIVLFGFCGFFCIWRSRTSKRLKLQPCYTTVPRLKSSDSVESVPFSPSNPQNMTIKHVNETRSHVYPPLHQVPRLGQV